MGDYGCTGIGNVLSVLATSWGMLRVISCTGDESEHWGAIYKLWTFLLISCSAKFEVPALLLWKGSLLWVWNTPLEFKSSAVFLAVLLQDWLQKTIGRVDALLMEVCRKFEAEKYATVSSEKLLVIVVKLLQKYMHNNNHNQQQVDLCPHLRACWTYALIEDSCPLCFR